VLPLRTRYPHRWRLRPSLRKKHGTSSRVAAGSRAVGSFPKGGKREGEMVVGQRKYDTRKTLEAFSAQLRDETDLDTLSNDQEGVVRENMQPAHFTLWLAFVPHCQKVPPSLRWVEPVGHLRGALGSSK
jgi:hypothetical protein